MILSQDGRYPEKTGVEPTRLHPAVEMTETVSLWSVMRDRWCVVAEAGADAAAEEWCHNIA
jgi:hypothetical protein